MADPSPSAYGLLRFGLYLGGAELYLFHTQYA
jgi:hypothetical protein